MNEKSNCLFKTVPAASALHQVPMFDPLKLLRKTTSAKTGEKVLKLDLQYKKLWFRLAYPDGRMFTKPLRITDQMAIFEAQLFAGRDDPTVFSQFTSCHTRSEAGPQYIRSAQEEALNEALDNAGFGIQLADLVEGSGDSGYGSEVLLSQVEALLREPEHMAPTEQPVPVSPVVSVPSVVTKAAVIQTPPAVSAPSVATRTAAEQTIPAAPVQVEEPVPAQVEMTAPVREEPEQTVQTVTETPASKPVEVAAPAAETVPFKVVKPLQQAAGAENPMPVHGAEPVAEAASEPTPEPQPNEPADSASDETANILQMLGGIPATASEPAPEPAEETRPAKRSSVVAFPHMEATTQTVDTTEKSEAPAAAEPVVETGVSYTEDMSVDEIRARMTTEQAKALTVSFGPNKGWTLGQVLERRPSSLKFYALVSQDASNPLKAGSFLLLDELA